MPQLQPVGERSEVQTPMAYTSASSFASTSVPSAFHSNHSKQQSNSSNTNLFDSLSSLLSESRRGNTTFDSILRLDSDLDARKIFLHGTCPSTHTPFHLKQLEYGNGSNGGWKGNRLNPATRQENVVLAQILARLDRESLKTGERGVKEEVTEDEALRFLTEKMGSGGFDKLFGEIQRLLEGRNDKTPFASIIEAAMNSKKYLATVAVSGTVVKEEVDVGLIRKPLRYIKHQLGKRIEMLQTNHTEWDIFESKIGIFKQFNLVQRGIK
jgi:hypothetical protein